MENNKYLFDFDTFVEEHPEVEAEWRDFMEPLFQSADDAMYGFIMSYIFM